MPSLAATASGRLIILTKACLFSRLTMHVWTWPKRLKMARISPSVPPAPPTNNVRLRTRMWSRGRLLSHSMYFELPYAFLGGLGWRRGGER
jgi:hypothetical protein